MKAASWGAVGDAIYRTDGLERMMISYFSMVIFLRSGRLSFAKI
jgi:hypothetical protein